MSKNHKAPPKRKFLSEIITSGQDLEILKDLLSFDKILLNLSYRIKNLDKSHQNLGKIFLLIHENHMI